MYGALVVYNRGDPAAATGPGSGKGGTLYGWKYAKDYVLLESEIGPSGYLVGDRLSLADLAVAGQLSLLKFPQAAGAPLAGWGVPGLADDPQLEPLFHWRDRIGAEVGRP